MSAARATRLDPETVVRTIRAEMRHHGGRMSWQQIRLAIEVCLDVDPTKVDWLTQVRGPLQWMINQGELRRVGGPHVEEYQTITTGVGA